jgi:hypothetical protein
VQQQHARPAFGFETGFQHMHAQAVDVFHEAGADAGGKRDGGEGRHGISSSWPGKSAKRVFALVVPAIHVFSADTL